MHITNLGCDPEVFLKHKLTGDFISSVGLIGGTKHSPQPIGEDCSVQEDNVTVEFNTPACGTVGAFINAINYNKQWIQERCAELNLDICIQPSAVFSDSELDSEGARTFGCEPDYNAWTGGTQNPRPACDNPNLRSAGGHIHIQLDDKSMDVLEVVQAMDVFVGCQMLIFDTDKGRRQLYGKAGAFRIKPYGVEYRTASNVWIESDARIQWAWDQTEKALAFVKSGQKIGTVMGQLVQDCINNSDLQLLEIINKEFGL